MRRAGLVGSAGEVDRFTLPVQQPNIGTGSEAEGVSPLVDASTRDSIR